MREAYLKRKKREEEERMRSVKRYWFVPFAVILFNLLYMQGRVQYNRFQVFRNPDTTVANIVHVDYRSFTYRFEVGGENYFRHVRTRKVGGFMVGKHNLPMYEGDQYLVIYKKDKPNFSTLDYELLIPQTLEHYLNVAESRMAPDFTDESGWERGSSACVVKEIYREEGLDGLADVIFHKTNLLDNILNNSFTFWLWKNSRSGRDIMEQCAPELNR
jgi:hypothetical protein